MLKLSTFFIHYDNSCKIIAYFDNGFNDLHVEYGIKGVVFIKGDIYSCGVLLIETLTRKKPTDEMFVGEMSLKHWVTESLPSVLTEVVDGNLLISSKE
ncbi:Uncharacterized protein TCM_031805 [Theobroma cacao]|uniref:Serine-threonine/tyrosine-protein kinase catalytic domain-containing protein n=1 Tax=Theobroma cacao TaxID=3641 RepID=A0A061F8C0_THECC|nr:Uncharacterized protein TCM_031805 [Theobroma cacao]